MRITKPDTVTLVHKRVDYLERTRCIVCAFIGFPLDDHKEGLLSEPDIWQCIADNISDDIFDEGFPKPSAEFFVYGACFPKPGMRAMETAVRVGDLEKRLEVYGVRGFDGSGIDDPETLDSTPLTWALAYGGPDFPDNPLGLGRISDADGVVTVPQMSYPGMPYERPDKPVRPAGFTAVPAHWPLRRQYMGTVDERGLWDEYPLFPSDTDTHYFLRAPEDQRLTGFFRGDEVVSIEGMHPDFPLLSGRLPGFRLRLFLERAPGVELHEVESSADSLWLFPRAKLGVLRYCGMAVVTSNASDPAGLLVGLESLDDPVHPAEHYRVIPPTPVAEAASVTEETPPAATAAVEESSEHLEIPGLLAVEQLVTELSHKVKAFEDKAPMRFDEAVARRGEILQAVNPEHREYFKSILDDPFTETVSESTKSDDGLERLQSLQDGVSAAVQDALDKSGYTEARLADAEAAMSGQIDEMLGMETQPDDPFSALSTALDGIIEKHGDLEIQMKDAVSGLHTTLTDAKPELAELFSEAVAGDDLISGETMHLSEIKTQAEALRASLAGIAGMTVATASSEAPHTGATAESDDRQPLDFRGLDLSGKDFTGQGLQGALFCDAILEETRFDEANLTGADFSRAVLHRARFHKANLQKTRFDKVHASAAVFTLVKMEGGRAEKADFSETDWSGADLRSTCFESTCFDQATMTGMIATKSLFLKSTFRRAMMRDVVFEGADLTRVDASGADMTGASLVRTRGTGLRLGKVIADRLDATEATLPGCRVDPGASLRHAIFRKADLRGAQWRGAVLHGADLRQTQLDKAGLGLADLHQAKLHDAVARKADLSQANLQEAGLAGVNLFKGSLRQANMGQADARGANFYGVDFTGANILGTNFQDCLTGKSLLDVEMEHDT
ncbi:DUF2169 family type VI secretion system accessory protein [Desulfovibrio inopinatus]|uniref:DUF2169 family type VI secretion system accessory protein n=1 Tax=Desulfovibrio inopinatus TaxID=102109 RepID=UPI0004063E97|nr:DUF2169 domain-containing protein [Desulfovibrio inopinatus]